MACLPPNNCCTRQPLGNARWRALYCVRLLVSSNVMRSQLLTDFEAAVLAWIASRSGDQPLQDQLSRVQVVERDYTVVGCYSTLAVPADAPASTAAYSKHGPLSGPNFESKAVEHGGGTLLWFEEGRASCLEIYVFGDYFPADHSELGKFELSGGA